MINKFNTDKVKNKLEELRIIEDSAKATRKERDFLNQQLADK
jgi:hypothetical protein